MLYSLLASHSGLSGLDNLEEWLIKYAEVVKLADALDSKSSGAQTPCGFESHLRHQVKALKQEICLRAF